MRSDPLIVLRLVVGVFEELEIPYFVGGSIASSVHGDFRATKDVDLIAKIEKSHVPGIVTRLQDEFYIDDVSIYEAIDTQTLINVIHRHSSGSYVQSRHFCAQNGFVGRRGTGTSHLSETTL